MTAKISLAQQLEAVEFALRRQQSFVNGTKNIRELRPEAVVRFDAERLEAAVKTLRWLQSSEPEIRKLLEVPAERRKLLWDHMNEVAALLDGKAGKPEGEDGQP